MIAAHEQSNMQFLSKKYPESLDRHTPRAYYLDRTTHCTNSPTDICQRNDLWWPLSRGLIRGSHRAELRPEQGDMSTGTAQGSSAPSHVSTQWEWRWRSQQHRCCHHSSRWAYSLVNSECTRPWTGGPQIDFQFRQKLSQCSHQFWISTLPFLLGLQVQEGSLLLMHPEARPVFWER